MTDLTWFVIIAGCVGFVAGSGAMTAVALFCCF